MWQSPSDHVLLHVLNTYVHKDVTYELAVDVVSTEQFVIRTGDTVVKTISVPVGSRPWPWRIDLAKKAAEQFFATLG